MAESEPVPNSTAELVEMVAKPICVPDESTE